MSKFTPISVHDLGDYLKEQRHTAQLSLRQLSDVAGISNPYLSQIERGLKKPSAEILQALAKALRISAESLYVRAGFLEDSIDRDVVVIDVPAAILADPLLTNRQRGVLMDVYESFVGDSAPTKATAKAAAEPAIKAPTTTSALAKLAKAAKAPAPTTTSALAKLAKAAKAPAPTKAPAKAARKPAVAANAPRPVAVAKATVADIPAEVPPSRPAPIPVPNNNPEQSLTKENQS